MHSIKFCSGVVPGSRLVASLSALSGPAFSSPHPVLTWHGSVSRSILSYFTPHGRYNPAIRQASVFSTMAGSSASVQPAAVDALLQCQLDSYARSCQATVLSCQPITPVAPPKAKGKQAQASATAGKPGSAEKTSSWSVTLDQSPLYPEGGGQPSDVGSLEVIHPDDTTLQNASAADNSAAMEQLGLQRVAITGVAREGGKLIHYVDAEVPVGASVCVRLDWGRRYDLMQQHTAQHLVSAVADIVSGADTLSWELRVASPDGASDTVAVELDITSISAAQIDDIERRCNAEIRAQRAVMTRLLVGPAEMALASDSPLFRGKLPPLDKIQGGLRLVEIEGVDLNACGGTHLKSLSEIQMLKLAGVERQRGHVVLRFIAGDRVLAALGRALVREASFNKRLSCAPAEHDGAVAGLLVAASQGLKQRKLLVEEVAQFQAAALVAQLPYPGAEAGAGGFAEFHRSGSDLAFLSSVGAAVQIERPNAVLLLTADSGSTGRLPSDAAGVFLVVGVSLNPPSFAFWPRAFKSSGCSTRTNAGPAELVKIIGPKIATLLGGRGGGRPGSFSGKASSFERLGDAKEILQDTCCPVVVHNV